MDAEICIARACRDGLDSVALRNTVARHLRRVVRFDASCWSTTDPATLLVTSAVSEGVSSRDTPRFLELEYLDLAHDRFGILARSRQPFSLSDHEDDADEAPAPRRRYADVLAPNGQRRELRVAFRSAGMCWGTVSLFRADGQPAFTVAEARWVASLGPTIATGLRLALLLAPQSSAAGGDEPGLVILADDKTPVAVTPTAAALLSELSVRPGDADEGMLPAAVYAVAAQARAHDRVGAAAVLSPARLRVRTSAGRWLVLYGARLAGEPMGIGQTMVIVERGRPSEITPLIVQAYALSPRESDVVRLVLGGYASAEMSDALGISVFTVQDHMKKIFDKVGVRSRRALVARVLGDHYFPKVGETPPAASGWFASGVSADTMMGG